MGNPHPLGLQQTTEENPKEETSTGNRLFPILRPRPETWTTQTTRTIRKSPLKGRLGHLDQSHLVNPSHPRSPPLLGKTYPRGRGQVMGPPRTSPSTSVAAEHRRFGDSMGSSCTRQMDLDKHHRAPTTPRTGQHPTPRTTEPAIHLTQLTGTISTGTTNGTNSHTRISSSRSSTPLAWTLHHQHLRQIMVRQHSGGPRPKKGF